MWYSKVPLPSRACRCCCYGLPTNQPLHNRPVTTIRDLAVAHSGHLEPTLQPCSLIFLGLDNIGALGRSLRRNHSTVLTKLPLSHSLAPADVTQLIWLLHTFFCAARCHRSISRAFHRVGWLFSGMSGPPGPRACRLYAHGQPVPQVCVRAVVEGQWVLRHRSSASRGLNSSILGSRGCC